MRPARTPRNPAPALSFTNLGECVRMPIKTPQNRPFRSFKAAARVRVPLGPPTLLKGLRRARESPARPQPPAESGAGWPPLDTDRAAGGDHCSGGYARPARRAQGGRTRLSAVD